MKKQRGENPDNNFEYKLNWDVVIYQMFANVTDLMNQKKLVSLVIFRE